MAKLLIDTNAAIALIKGEQNATQVVTEAEYIAVPIVAVGELFFGAEKSVQVANNIREIEIFLQQRIVLQCDIEVAI